MSDFAHALTAIAPETSVYTHRKGAHGVYSPPPHVVEYPWLGSATSLTSVNLGSARGLAEAVSLMGMGSLGYLRLCRRRRIRHSLAMWAVPSGIFAYAAKRVLGIDYSVWVLGSDIWRYEHHAVMRPVLRRVLASASHLFADGWDLAARAEALGGRPCSFLPSSTDLSVITPVPVSEDRPHPRFIYVGRLEQEKGPDVLLDAARLYLDRGGAGSVDLFGQGSMRRNLDDAVGRLRLAPRVRLHGPVSTPELVGRLRWGDCQVIPSRIESLPVALSEAVQMALPVIATDAGDIARVVGELNCGLTVPAEDPEALASAMLQFDRPEVGPFDLRDGFREPYLSPSQAAERFLATIGLHDIEGAHGRSQG